MAPSSIKTCAVPEASFPKAGRLECSVRKPRVLIFYDFYINLLNDAAASGSAD